MAKRKSVLLWVLLMFVAAGGMWALLDRMAGRERKELQGEHLRAMANRKRDFAKRASEQKLAAYQRNQEAQLRRERELEQALGGPAAAAAKNPELSIAQTIEQVAQRCAPKATRVSVRVDRFTEFDCLLQLPRQLAAKELAVLARCVLEYAGQYLDRLQFGFRGNVFAELGRGEIESIAGWSSTDLVLVESWLKERRGTGTAPEGTGSSAVAPNTERSEASNLSASQKLHRDVIESFNAAYKTAHEQFGATIKLLEESVDLKNLSSYQQFQERQKLLLEAEKQANAARFMLQNPASEYTRMLQAAGVDSVYIQASSRTMATRFAGTQAEVASAFRALDGRLKSSRAYLETLAKYFGAWTYLPAQQTMEFDNPAAQKAYAQARERLERDAQALDTAIKNWNAAQEQIRDAQ
jgi:hypothetical protein